jgi:hypothetical protein
MGWGIRQKRMGEKREEDAGEERRGCRRGEKEDAGEERRGCGTREPVVEECVFYVL